MLTRQERRKAVERVFGAVQFYNSQEDRIGAVMDYIQLAINYFFRLDRDADGYVTLEEMDELMQERGPVLSKTQKEAVAWLRAHFNELARSFDDGDGDRGISRKDLFEVGKLAAWLSYFHNSFHKVDANKDEVLTLAEVRQYVKDRLELDESDQRALDKVFDRMAQQKGDSFTREDLAAFFDDLNW